MLVLRSQQGDRAALEQLVQRWQQPMYRYALRMLGDSDGALDTVQETWLAAIKGIVGLKDITRFRVWLFRVLANKCRDRGRVLARTKRRLQKIAQQPIRDSVPCSQQELQDNVRHCLEQMSTESKSILLLRYMEDFSLEDIADVLGLPDGTVRSRLHRARKQLRDILERT